MKRPAAQHLVPLVKATGFVAALACLGGCATAPTPMAAIDDGIDHTKVQAVERAATRYGVKVYWVNMPQQRKPS